MWVGYELHTYVLFQDGIMIMFIKMEEPKDFVTWLQVAKVMVLAYTVGGTAESVWWLWESKTQLGGNICCGV